MTNYRGKRTFNDFRSSLSRTLLGLACLLHSTWSFGQEAADLDQLNRREDLRQRIVEMESSLGNHNPALIEPLESLAKTATTLDLHSEASTLLDRAIQIERLNSGLFSNAQIPLYFSMMTSDTRIGNWSDVNESLDYLDWLLREKNIGSEGTLLDNLIQLSEFHLQGVANDAVTMQAHHYREAMGLVFLALRISERTWGPSDSRRLDLYYSLAKQYYLQSIAVDRKDDTAYALRAVVPGSNWVKPRHVVQYRFYRSGLRLFDDMREILAESAESPAESVAMLDLYIADWHLLFNQERAGARYRQAYEALQTAGNAPDELDELFSRPQILPTPNFHSTVNSAMAAVDADARLVNAHSNSGAETGHLFRLEEWFEAMPVIPFPVIAPNIGQRSSVSHTDTRLHFRLNSLHKVSRWVGGTYKSHISVVEEFTVLDSEENLAVDMEYLDDRLHFLRFRPRLKNGIAQSSEGILLYQAVK